MDKTNRWIGIVILIIVGFCISIDNINKFFNNRNMYIVVEGNWGIEIGIFIVVLLTILITIFITRYFKNTIVKVILAIGILIFGLYAIFLVVFTIPSWEYKTFESPNKDNTVIIRENIFLFGGDIQVLKMKNRFLGELIKEETSDEDNRLDGNFSFKWENNNEAIFRYRDFGSSNITKIKF